MKKQRRKKKNPINRSLNKEELSDIRSLLAFAVLTGSARFLDNGNLVLKIGDFCLDCDQEYHYCKCDDCLDCGFVNGCFCSKNIQRSDRNSDDVRIEAAKLGISIFGKENFNQEVQYLINAPIYKNKWKLEIPKIKKLLV